MKEPSGPFVVSIIFLLVGGICIGVGLGLPLVNNPSNQMLTSGISLVIFGCTLFLSGIIMLVTENIKGWLSAIYGKVDGK
ncbi:MAG: hypothetical protein A2Y57_03300 [Candidatus Woykebacteria bacterium RBG_13_40_7b]|uniref:MotA/TolQ/ExbB proton channel domain-containing protein n=1 Tax=Candidatus Woykebacteria bacterium RBG_13_40_7b TaxID=1802594 RepID=A0A1G1WAI4_9BACT|nr:MAG: hypothetical protein A2Y57_03300 [Candidatus Woykebacteria bacterium RBG_13_40_7b]